MLPLHAGDLRRVLDMVSPSALEVIPPTALWREGRRLLATRRDDGAFHQVLAAARPVLEGPPVNVTLTHPDRLPKESQLDDPVRRGQTVLRLYFAQIAHLERAAIDLRADRFASSGEETLWAPRTVVSGWSPSFIRSVRGLYEGFYRDDETLFRRATSELGLAGARDLFLQHFGPGDQTRVVFDMEHFKSSFHAIFLRCRDRGVTLDSGFLSLGIYLATLYDNLSGLGVPLDVRGAFEAVWTS